MVHIQQWLVKIGKVKIILCFVIFSKSFIFRGREFTEWSKISVYISYVESMGLIKISISKKNNIDITVKLLLISSCSNMVRRLTV